MLTRRYGYMHVVPGCAGCAMAHPDFGRSVNPISTRGDELCPSNNTGTPGFSDLVTGDEIETSRSTGFDY